MLKRTWEQASVLLGVVLATLTIVSLLQHGLAVELHGLPAIVAKWYTFIFHGLFDLLFGWVRVDIPLWLKDIFSFYLISGFVVLRAIALQKNINFMDEIALSDFEVDTLERLYRFLVLSREYRGARERYRWARHIVARALILAGWPIIVPYLYWTWTIDARLSLESADQVEREMRFEPETRDQFEMYTYLSEKEWEHRFQMYMAVIERDSTLASLSVSVNLVFLSLVAFFVWSELSVAPL